jgi:glycosyltransferase involved in cell wall biosynthesis
MLGSVDESVPWSTDGVSIRRAHDFPFLHDRKPYDLTVHQLGNAACHAYQWPYLLRVPGLVVLHDGQLHHARAGALLSTGRRRDYAAEFRWSHPHVDPRAAAFAIAGFTGTTYYLWPMVRLVLTRARLAAVHTPWLACALSTAYGADVRSVRMGVAEVPDRVRPAGGPLRVSAFGLVTPEKRIAELLEATATLGSSVPPFEIRLVGARAPHFDVDALVARLGLAGRVLVTGHVPDEALAGELADTDIALCLRWPTSHETSASWLRALAAGRPTVVTDLAHTARVPLLDPRTWRVGPAAARVGTGGRLDDPEPIGVGIDILDEAHSLRLALARLLTDTPLRCALGAAARAHWQREHTIEAMVGDYLSLVEEAARRPARPVPADIPAHVLDDGSALAARLAHDGGFAHDPLAL